MTCLHLRYSLQHLHSVQLMYHVISFNQTASEQNGIRYSIGGWEMAISVQVARLPGVSKKRNFWSGLVTSSFFSCSLGLPACCFLACLLMHLAGKVSASGAWDRESRAPFRLARLNHMVATYKLV